METLRPYQFLRIATLLLCVMSTACMSIHTKTPEGLAVSMDEREFASYLEQVFRHHNRVVNDQINTSADDESPDIQHAEKSMNQACLPLNELVSASAMGQKGSFWARKHLPDAVPRCETATRELENLLVNSKGKAQ
jgi:hypothetical protein